MSVFSTPVKFIYQPPPSLMNTQARQLPFATAQPPSETFEDLSPWRQLWIEKLSGYFSPTSDRLFLATSYNAKERLLRGTFEKNQPSGFFATLLKILSYLTIILPIIAWIGLQIAKLSLMANAPPEPFLPTLPSRTPEPSPQEPLVAPTPQVTPASPYRCGGEATLNDQRVWISFRSIPPAAGTLVGTSVMAVQIKSFDLQSLSQSKAPSCLIAQAKFSTSDQGLQLQEVFLNSSHPYLMASEHCPRHYANFSSFDDAPDNLMSALLPVARCLFYACVRWHLAQEMSDAPSSASSPEEGRCDPSALGPSERISPFARAPSWATEQALLAQLSAPPLFSPPRLWPQQASPAAGIGWPQRLPAYHPPRSEERSPAHVLPICITGKLAHWLTQDGPERVVADIYRMGSRENLYLNIDPYPYRHIAQKDLSLAGSTPPRLQHSKRLQERLVKAYTPIRALPPAPFNDALQRTLQKATAAAQS